MNLVPVEGENHLYRDTNTNAIVSTNQSEHAMYLSRKKIQENEKDRINSIECEVTSIKNDLDEIKTLLKNLSKGL
jgi:hypothetical protein